MRTTRALLRGLGELLLTAGVLVLLYCAYTLAWTNVRAGVESRQATDELRQQWRRPDPPGRASTATPSATRGRTSAPPATPAAPVVGSPGGVGGEGQGLALMYVPRLGASFVQPVLEGVQAVDLARGLGHYPSSAMPGAIGNFAVAGHRSTHGEPFAYLDGIRPGDQVVVETRDEWITYVVDPAADGTGWYLVPPTRTDVVYPVPGEPGATPTRALLTLTTCNPRWGSTQRLIVAGHLEGRQPKSAGRPAALAG